MKQKEAYILIIFIFTFLAFIYLAQPPYIGYTTQNVTTSIYQNKINALQALQEDPDILEIIQTLNIDIPSVISSLYNYDLQVQTTEQDIALNDTEKADMISNLETQVDNLLIDLPKLIVITNKISGLPATPPVDITPEMLPAGTDTSLIEEILFLQEQVEAKTDIKVFSILTFSEEESSGTYIKKTINAPVQDGYVLEIIPSTITVSEEELNFLGEYEVISSDPLILSTKLSNGLAVYSYIIPRDIFILSEQIQTVAVPYEVEITEPVIEVACGDGICTEYLEDEITCPMDCARKIPWTLIISIIIILVVGIILTHLFRHKLKRLFKREGPVFKTESDKENLKNYVKASLSEGIKEEQIKSILLSKGWTERQINIVINEIMEQQKEVKESTEESQEE